MPLGVPLLDALDRMRYGGVILNGSGKVTRLNAAAEQYLREYTGAASAAANDPDWTRFLRRLIGAGKGHTGGEAALWVTIVDAGAPKLILYSRRISNAEEGALTVITLVDLTEPPLPSAETLQKLFGLTSAEARLAREIARGLSAGEAAKALGVKMATVRPQMVQIFAKTGTKRQGELVALLTRLAILP